MRWLDGITDLMNKFEQALGVDDGQGKPGMLQSMGSQKNGHDLVTEEQISVCLSCHPSVPFAMCPTCAFFIMVTSRA